MAAPFMAMAGVHWLALILLYVGMALTLVATVLYIRHGLAQARKLTLEGKLGDRRPPTRIRRVEQQRDDSLSSSA